MDSRHVDSDSIFNILLVAFNSIPREFKLDKQAQQIISTLAHNHEIILDATISCLASIHFLPVIASTFWSRVSSV